MNKTLLILAIIFFVVVSHPIPSMFAEEELMTHPENKFIAESERGETPTIAESNRGDYRIGCGDILEIITWKEPDFTKDNIFVRIDGKISFPLLNDVQAEGLTLLQLKMNIQELLKNYVKDPLVTVVMKNMVSQRFYILGEVARTGAYPLDKELTVLQAFAIAGGFTEWASKKEIILIRHEEGENKLIRINYHNIVKGKDFSQNIRIKADDTLIIP